MPSGKVFGEVLQQALAQKRVTAELRAAFSERVIRARLKPGRVPNWVFWLIDGNDYIGRLILRSEVNEHLLQVGGHIGYEIRPSRRRKG